MTDEHRDNVTDPSQDDTEIEDQAETAGADVGQDAEEGVTPEEEDASPQRDVDFQIVRSHLSRATMTYFVALILIGFVALMSFRTGMRVDRFIPASQVNWFRAGELVWIMLGFVGLGTYVLNLMRRRAKRLGETPATADVVGESFIQAKRAASFVFGLAGLIGLSLVLAGHEPKWANLSLLILPIVLLIMSWPNETGLFKFADQIETLRQGAEWPEGASADGSEPSAGGDKANDTKE